MEYYLAAILFGADLLRHGASYINIHYLGLSHVYGFVWDVFSQHHYLKLRWRYDMDD